MKPKILKSQNGGIFECVYPCCTVTLQTLHTLHKMILNYLFMFTTNYSPYPRTR